MALWPRKRETPRKSTPGVHSVEWVRLDSADHAWWAQEEVKEVWRPKPHHKAASAPERDILAEHFGTDWRTSFGFTPSTDDDAETEAEAEAETEPTPEGEAIDELDPYAVLEVAPDATWDEIIAAHRYQARVHHPDLLFGQSAEEKARSEERIRVINAAYKELRIRRGM